jgi:SnoaL-like domain
VTPPTAAEITELLARWWLRYDAGDIDDLKPLLTEDATFRCRTDTGQTDYEEFVRADHQGPDEICHWQGKHRAASPHPLRHMTLNVAVDATAEDSTDFTSYLFVTQVKGGRPDPLPGGVLHGTARRADDGLRFSALELVLDTQESIPLEERRA